MCRAGRLLTALLCVVASGAPQAAEQRGVARPRPVFTRAALEAADGGCSRLLSREALALIETHVLEDTFRNHGVLPAESCPLLPARFAYSGHERQKLRLRTGAWQCLACGKQFTSEGYLDFHLHSHHPESAHDGVDGAASSPPVCLADFCGLLGCPSAGQGSDAGAAPLLDWLGVQKGSGRSERQGEESSTDAEADSAASNSGGGSVVADEDEEGGGSSSGSTSKEGPAEPLPSPSPKPWLKWLRGRGRTLSSAGEASSTAPAQLEASSAVNTTTDATSSASSAHQAFRANCRRVLLDGCFPLPPKPSPSPLPSSEPVATGASEGSGEGGKTSRLRQGGGSRNNSSETTAPPPEATLYERTKAARRALAAEFCDARLLWGAGGVPGARGALQESQGSGSEDEAARRRAAAVADWQDGRNARAAAVAAEAAAAAGARLPGWAASAAARGAAGAGRGRGTAPQGAGGLLAGLAAAPGALVSWVSSLLPRGSSPLLLVVLITGCLFSVAVFAAVFCIGGSGEEGGLAQRRRDVIKAAGTYRSGRDYRDSRGEGLGRSTGVVGAGGSGGVTRRVGKGRGAGWGEGEDAAFLRGGHDLGSDERWEEGEISGSDGEAPAQADPRRPSSQPLPAGGFRSRRVIDAHVRAQMALGGEASQPAIEEVSAPLHQPAAPAAFALQPQPVAPEQLLQQRRRRALKRREQVAAARAGQGLLPPPRRSVSVSPVAGELSSGEEGEGESAEEDDDDSHEEGGGSSSWRM